MFDPQQFHNQECQITPGHHNHQGEGKGKVGEGKDGAQNRAKAKI